MASPYIQKFRSDLTKKLHEPNKFNEILGTVEGKTGVDRTYFILGIAGIFALYLIFGHFAELVCNTIGFLYPAYISIKAIESATKDDDTQWLTYWVVFGLFNVIEFASDIIVGWFPIYWLVKCAFMLYLYLPMTLGAQKIYMRFVQPFITKHGSAIDQRINKAFGTVTDGIDAAKEALKNQ